MSGVKQVYLFTEGNAEMKKLLGGKGANLAEMTRLGLPVPPGFTVTTEACVDYYRKGETLWPELEEEVAKALQALEKQTGKTLGGGENPLCFQSVPGIFFNAGNDGHYFKPGLNDKTVEDYK